MKFIEVTVEGKKRLINLNLVGEVRPSEDGKTTVYVVSTASGANAGWSWVAGLMEIDETYDEIKGLIRQAQTEQEEKV